MRTEHQQLGLQNGCRTQGQVNRHLVPVEVGVESRASQGVQLKRLPLNQLGLESLDAETVQGWCTVEEHRVSLHHVLQDVPHHGLLRIHNLLGALHGLDHAALDHLADDEGLVQFRGHVLGHATLVELEVRPHDDDRTCRVVHTLAQQVLTETALLSFQAVAQGLQRTVAFRLHRAGLAAVVEQAVHRFLQHALLVAQDHFRCLDLHQTLQAVVADDHAAVQVVQVRGRKAATVKWHQGAQLRWNHRHDLHHHPLRGVFNAAVGIAQRLHNLQTLELLALALLRSLSVRFVTK